VPRHEPLGRPVPATAPELKVRVRRGASGRLEVVVPDRALTETTEAAERPPTPDDPRTANVRNIPPFGAGV
jgi:hypothetical protein